MSKECVAVIGAGTMGAGIAGQAALCGMKAYLFDISADQLRKGMETIRGSYNKGLQRQKVSEDAVAAAHDNLTETNDLATAIANATIIIEAIPERMSLKKALFAEIEAQVSEDVILGSNTSSLSITELAGDLKHPGRCVGLHFFNPVAVMKLLEIVRGAQTSDDTMSRVTAFAAEMKKEHITVKDSPGFATSRLGIALGNEAMRMFEEGVASAADIDKAMSLGYRHPIGPLALSDLVGLDVRLAITKHLYKELGTDTFKPAPILEKMVEDGHLGRKSGQGFYTYETAKS
jgi:3-hydroxybutyryl-CoA dehydrogenase